MPEIGTHPKLLFFQWDHAPNQDRSAYLLQHMQQHVYCLKQFFDVTVIRTDCDYVEVCDRFEPDIVLFESGYRSHGSRRIKIDNVHSNRSIPRIGLHNGDSWCDRRTGFLSDMEAWSIDTYFSICVTARDYMPMIKDQLFLWPNAIDPSIHHDYRMNKVTKILFTGQINDLYPWRQRARAELAHNFGVTSFPTISYDDRRAVTMPYGEAYARSLNASLIVPTCGTMAGELVRKHLEIPGCMACLVSQDTPVLRRAGFVDMENCVLADGRELVDRINQLLDNDALTRQITEAGYRLVHSKHTIANRSQIYDWFILNNNLASGERIIQECPFGDLRILSEDRPAHNAALTIGPDRRLLVAANAYLRQGNFQSAIENYQECLSLVHYLPEAKLGVAICLLATGQVRPAQSILVNLIETTLFHYGAATPDPVEWSYFLLCLVCQRRLDEAQWCSNMYPSLASHELAWARSSIRSLKGNHLSEAGISGSERLRPSIHHHLCLSAREWTSQFISMLDAANQTDMASLLRGDWQLPCRASTHIYGRCFPISRSSVALRELNRLYSWLDHFLVRSEMTYLRPNVPPLHEFSYLRRLYRKAIRDLLEILHIKRPIIIFFRAVGYFAAIVHSMIRPVNSNGPGYARGEDGQKDTRLIATRVSSPGIVVDGIGMQRK